MKSDAITVIVETALRGADVGGWTDTWFAKKGCVCNLALLCRLFGQNAPYRGVTVIMQKRNESGARGSIYIRAADPHFDIVSSIGCLKDGNFDRHNLLLATLSLVDLAPLMRPDLDIYITSPVPPGASMGTSAAVSVALIKAINLLLAGSGAKALSPDEKARLAHRAETEVMEGESGTQDQWSAAFSRGAQFIAIPAFPETKLEQVELSAETARRLEGGLVSVFVGNHNSSDVHRIVIRELEGKSGESPKLSQLCQLALAARQALEKDSLHEYGQILNANTEVQRTLHSGLVGPDHQKVLLLAQHLPGFLGGKVNGAGGGGGSVTLLFDSKTNAAHFVQLAGKMYQKEGYLYYEHKLAGR